MARIRPLTSALALIASLVSTAAQAGRPGTFVEVGPVGIAVPTLSENLLIALGLLLIVIALRVMRSKQAAHRLLSWFIMVCGVAVGTLGVEQTVASGATVNVSGDGCSSNVEIPFDPFQEDTLSNQCDIAIRIISFRSSRCDLETETAVCKVGLVLQPGASCEFLPTCGPG